MREVTLPERLREIDRTLINPPIPDPKEYWEKRLAQSAKVAAECLAGLTTYQVLTIRREVALRLPDRPMSLPETQLWLDENTAGVAHYMKTGKVYGL